ncbi:hypothetical protein W04_3101 [Pseudoalteromonas sp. SW0106-04]|nr:hypothetical protein W04_3101 [Pseudoalteromonas sp. SW0106-04]
MIVRQIEEPYLKKVHGDDFLKYKSDINRYIPKLSRFKF